MKYLIAGLGNMDLDYMNTRHNVGFEVVDVIAERNKIKWESGRYAHYCEFKYKGRQIIMIKPTTYMNLSGKAVRYWTLEKQIQLENILVVLDDLNLEFGKIRIKGEGTDGGHNGLKDITAQMGTTRYPRLRIGIGKDFQKGNQINFVLGHWSEAEKIVLESVLEKSADACLSFCMAGLPNTMNQYNSFKATPPSN